MGGGLQVQGWEQQQPSGGGSISRRGTLRCRLLGPKRIVAGSCLWHRVIEEAVDAGKATVGREIRNLPLWRMRFKAGKFAKTTARASTCAPIESPVINKAGGMNQALFAHRAVRGEGSLAQPLLSAAVTWWTLSVEVLLHPGTAFASRVRWGETRTHLRGHRIGCTVDCTSAPLLARPFCPGSPAPFRLPKN